MARKEWSFTEEKLLIDNYHTMTIKELEVLLSNRNADMINAKIKRLKFLGKLVDGKEIDTRIRAYKQRGI